MITLGYKLSSEEFGPADLVRFAVRGEKPTHAAGADCRRASGRFRN